MKKVKKIASVFVAVVMVFTMAAALGGCSNQDAGTGGTVGGPYTFVKYAFNAGAWDSGMAFILTYSDAVILNPDNTFVLTESCDVLLSMAGASGSMEPQLSPRYTAVGTYEVVDEQPLIGQKTVRVTSVTELRGIPTSESLLISSNDNDALKSKLAGSVLVGQELVVSDEEMSLNAPVYIFDDFEDPTTPTGGTLQMIKM